MRLTILNFSFFLLIAIKAYGQNNPEATKILDRFSATALGAPSVSIKFHLITTDQMENTNDTLAGSLILSKDKYKLDLPDNSIWFNGETSWSYLPAENEVTITKADKKDNSFQNRPSSIFTMYNSGYKSKLIEERSSYFIIDLYPEDIKSDLLRIRLSIGKSLMDLISLEYKKRDGILITLKVDEYNLKVKTDKNTFVFKPVNIKEVEVIDMR
ncbi:MAG TPA: outer membrane lipoprotein carrier protein LolA [Bacteroidales bacterium]|nr:outer membrane lipoprotein carrier protein LolA [Bacteroidales bacterium]